MFAHQGGWDEGLLVAGPMLAIVGLLWLAKRRSDRIARARLAESERIDDGE